MTFSDWYMSWLDESIRTADLENGVVDLLVRGEKLKAVSFYQERAGANLDEAERAVKAIITRYQIGNRRNRRRDLLTGLMLIALAAVLGLAIALWRG